MKGLGPVPLHPEGHRWDDQLKRWVDAKTGKVLDMKDPAMPAAGIGMGLNEDDASD